MHPSTRRALDRAFAGAGFLSILLMAAALLLVLAPIVWHGSQAFVFQATSEHRRQAVELFGHGEAPQLAEEQAAVAQTRQPVYDILARHEAWIANQSGKTRREAQAACKPVKEYLRYLLGPLPGDPKPVLPRDQYGCCRWDLAQAGIRKLLYAESWEEQFDADGTPLASRQVFTPRAAAFAGSPLAELFPLFEDEARVRAMLRPRWTFYGGFLTDGSRDAHLFGGIAAEFLGTLWLSLGAMLFAVPTGILSAIWLAEYAGKGWTVSAVRACISTLAGVPSIVFGLFGLAFFINTIKVSDSKSVLAGALTLSLMILPTIIRASEEAVKSVPRTYVEAALGLGAAKWRAIATVVLPSALPGILTGIVISMGRAAGETAPIIFTAAVSVGAAPRLAELASQPTPALPWNIYNLAAEHEAPAEIQHVRYGMVLSLILLVLGLNLAAILLRARISKRLKG